MSFPNLYVRTEIDQRRAVDAVESLPIDGKATFEIRISEKKTVRSLAQNRILWKWNSEIQAHMADHYGHMASAEDWHEVLCEKLLPTHIVEIDGEYHTVRTRTSKLSVADMADYLTRLEMYCAEYLNIQLTRPDNDYMTALMRSAEDHSLEGF